MCGIAGAIALNKSTLAADQLSEVAARMTARMFHRGPDGGGQWIAADNAVALAHRRLSIVDLSELGTQPMSYAGGRYQITFNGEIYNFRDLTAELTALGCKFRSTSDTEVLLAAVAQWGLTEALRRLVGMFAFALWDGEQRVLHLARDRLGEKPLYLGQLGSYLYFASELRAFSAIPQFSRRVSADATAAYLRDGYVPEPLSIYEGIFKLPPGSSLSIPAMRGAALPSDPASWSEPSQHSASALQPQRYWRLTQVADAAQSAQLRDPVEASAELERRLRNAAREQMLCDVPVGAFLSGGVDSSLVTAVMQAEANSPVRTFTVAFDKPEFDESEHARRVAAHLGTNHEQVLLSEAEVVGCVPHTIGALDEPTANGSFFPVYLISKFARTRVTVVLSGDGGDEFFAGYNRYRLTLRAWQRLRNLPRPMRALLRSVADAPNYRSMDGRASLLRRLLPLGSQVSLGNSLAKLSRLAQAGNLEECYRLVTSCWPNPDVVRGAGWLPPRSWHTDLPDDLSRMLLADQLDYLPGDNLAKVDRASMAVSLETRLPLLDHRIVEFSWQVANELKLRGDGTTKYLMRSVLDRFVPRELTERPKMGFTVPTDQWLLGPLREWAQDMLQCSSFRTSVPLAHDAVAAAWRSYVASKRPSDYQMWSLVMLAAWANGTDQVLS
jgi:asparagine synthase (glutamine-hydrolysing)